MLFNFSVNQAAVYLSVGAPQQLTIRRPDDWHLHVRDGSGLQSVVPHSARHFGRAVIMPNLQPPITTAQQVRNLKKGQELDVSG